MRVMEVNRTMNMLKKKTLKHMRFIGMKERKSELGYEYQISIYQAQNCNECPLCGECHKGEDNRRVELNHKLINYRK
jgi:hypothetical protein